VYCGELRHIGVNCNLKAQPSRRALIARKAATMAKCARAKPPSAACRSPPAGVPAGPWLMKGAGRLVRPLVFTRPG
jgi:hypothetical protein